MKSGNVSMNDPIVSRESSPVVVVVDDDSIIRAATARLLRNAGMKVEEAANGASGAVCIRAVKPDVALIDVDLGDADGRELCAELRAEPGLENTFWVLISGVSTSPDDQIRGLEGGADGYIARPIDNRELVARVRAFLRIRDAERERRDAERALDQARRLTALGTLAGGVAHNLNNRMMGVLGNAELCRDDTPPGHPIRQYLDGIFEEANRATALVRQLLAVAQHQLIAPSALELNAAATSLLGRLRRLVGAGCDLTWTPGAATLLVSLDGAQLDQILSELCQNARDACQGSGRPGVIHIETTRIGIVADSASAPSAPGEYAVLKVEDNGQGMSDAVREHLFEPFFTTANPAFHSGLGLAAVRGMVMQNGGFVEADSRLGQGTCIKVYLPIREGLQHE